VRVPEREADVLADADVVVAGGGPAGLGAAVAAARAGASVVLCERYGFLGGNLTVAKVGTICGLYVGDEKLFALQNAGYGVVLLPPGEHQLVVRNLCFPAVQQKIAVRAGEPTFLRFSVPDPLRPPPNESSGHWLADMFQLSERTAELRKWSEEWCQQAPRFEAVETRAAQSEIALTKLVDGASAEGIRPK